MRSRYWFTRGRNPLDVTVGQIMEENHVREHLPPLLWRQIEHTLPKSSWEVFPNGQLSVVSLAKIYEDLKSGST